MQQNTTRMTPRGFGNDYEDGPRTRNASRARSRQVNREHRGDRRKNSIMLRQVISAGDYSNWL